MRKEKKKNTEEKKIVNYRIETCRRGLIGTPLYQVGAVNFVSHGILFISGGITPCIFNLSTEWSQVVTSCPDSFISYGRNQC
jgi:hypothetical protein